MGTSSSPSGKNDERSVTVTAPGTVANIVCGYDVMGLALHEPCDEVTVTLNDSGRVTLEITGDGGLLPTDIDSNVASAMVKLFLERTDRTNLGAHVHLRKNMPLNSGMGSSSASTVPLDAVELPYPEHLHLALVHPHIDVPTRESRKILKSRISIPEAVTQWGNVAGLVAGFCKKDTALIGRSMTDVIFEPVRSMLIPGFYEMKIKAMELGAVGFGISGSGPSVFALCESEADAVKIAEALTDFLNSIGIDADKFKSGINAEGARIL
ncbi:MAG: homoserine kinase [Flavobacteriales bacterium]|nr:homoserine kinase [Flavobacteriales bacterium]